MPHLNKLKKQMERMNKRHPPSELPSSEQNKLNNLTESNSIPNQIPIFAGPLQAAQEANTGNTANEFFIRAAANRAEYATGEPREATQQASTQRGSISADAFNNLVMEHSNQNLSGINDLPQQPITTVSHHTATASENLGESNQTASDFHIIPHMANYQHNMHKQHSAPMLLDRMNRIRIQPITPPQS